jgi:hypothetical protein
MKWEKERSIKKCSTFHISVDKDINLPKWDVRANSIRKDIFNWGKRSFMYRLRS